jgi:arginine-tRNA-protein transferase
LEPYLHHISPAALSGDELDALLARGWFRMQQDMFTASHIQQVFWWRRVHWLRYPVEAIVPRRSHTRIRKKNHRWRIVIGPAAPIPKVHERLYQKYYLHIDFDGAESVADCLFGDGPPGLSVFQTRCISLYHGARLIAAGYFDVGRQAAASILHFYHPEYRGYSLGKALMLITLDYLRQHQIKFYYPGYVVEGDRKMNYKLFLGAGAAQYFDPETTDWRPLAQLPDAEKHFYEIR